MIRLALATIGILLGIAACGAFVDKPTEAAAGYDAQQKACIAKYESKVEIDKCRDKVKSDWVKDAGHE